METKRYITIDEFFNDFCDGDIYYLTSNYRDYYFMTFIDDEEYNRIFIIFKKDNTGKRYCYTKIDRVEMEEEDFSQQNTYDELETTFDELNKQIEEIIKKDNERNENE